MSGLTTQERVRLDAIVRRKGTAVGVEVQRVKTSSMRGVITEQQVRVAVRC